MATNSVPVTEAKDRALGGPSHGVALAVVLAAVLAYFAPLLVRGEVILGDDYTTAAELDVLPPRPGSVPRRMRDQSSVYVPELEHQLHGDRSSWISTWNPHNELGRPDWHVSGFSKAFAITHLLSFAVDDAFVLYTLLVAIAVVLSTLFGYLLLRDLGLVPAACACGALLVGLGFYVTFWLTYAMYLWGVCWTLGLLWWMPRLVRGRRPVDGLGVAFVTHALLLTAYPQQIVWSAYLLALVVGRELWTAPASRRERGRALAALAAAVVVGCVSVAPVYVELFRTSLRSARLDTGTAFYLDILPDTGSLKSAALLVGSLFDAFWFGHPLYTNYPLEVRGVCWTPLCCVLLPIALAHGGLRRHWPWVTFVAATLLVTFSAPCFAFGVQHLGLSLSRHAPLAGAHVPVAVLAAYAADRLLRGELRAPSRLVLAAVPVALALLAAGLSGQALVAGSVAAGLVLALGAIVFVWRPRPALLLALALAGTGYYGVRLALTQPLAVTRVRPELVQRIHQVLGDGERYAWAGRQFFGALHPNQETLYDLYSIHANDSLSSRAYQEWVSGLHPKGAVTEGRLFARIENELRLQGTGLGFAGVGLLLSMEPLPEAVATLLGKVGLIGFYRPTWRPILEAQLVDFAPAAAGAVRVDGPLARARKLPVERALDRDDELRFHTTAQPQPSLLFVSQQYHPGWRATSEGQRLETVTVNGLYLGVLLPPGTAEVRLEFASLVQWSWLPQAAFLLAFFGLALAAARGRRAR